MITGDNRRTAGPSLQVGITSVIARCPRRQGRRVERLPQDARVAFVGVVSTTPRPSTAADLGWRSAPVRGGGGAGQVVLMSGDPELAEVALGLAGATFRVIKQNLFWAFAYNTAAIPLAAFGLLDPMIAAAAMAMSSVSVVGNSLRLRRYR
jgi:Cu+-exporting ATPase